MILLVAAHLPDSLQALGLLVKSPTASRGSSHRHGVCHISECTNVITSIATSSIDLVRTRPQVESVTYCISCICRGSTSSIEKNQRHLRGPFALALCFALAFALARVW